MTKPKGTFRMKEYRRRKAQAERPFIAWDGEGINQWETESGIAYQNYSMLASSVGDLLVAPENESLERMHVIQMFMDCAKKNPGAIHVIFGGNYDFNMIMRGNQPPQEYEMLELQEEAEMRVGIFRVKIMWGRMMEISGPGYGTMRIYDVMPFFQTTFINACDQYLGKDWEGRDLIIKMKAERDSFNYSEMEEVIRYNDMELRNLVRLCNELRDRLYSVGLRIGHWYGPGAIAAYIYKQNGIKNCMDQHRAENYPEFGAAVRAAYAGGRFEVIRTGYNVPGPVYEYDINSAYPYAMTQLPDLATGWWENVEGDPGDKDFALYHLHFDTPSHVGSPGAWKNPFPLFHRAADSSIFFPGQVKGWFWSPEVKMAREYVARYGGSIIIDKAFVYHSDGEKPFSFVQHMYDERQRLKKEGSGAQIGLKLGLNSLYGKMAQQVGWTEERLPPFHQLEWAGFVTSSCRAQVMSAVMDKLDKVVAFATDAVFVTEPLDVQIGSGLGKWEEIVFSDMSMLQSGMYFGTCDSKLVVRTRGVRESDFDCDLALSKLRAGDNNYEYTARRFVGFSNALNTHYLFWGSWRTQHFQIALMLSSASKRVHGRWNASGGPNENFGVCYECEEMGAPYAEGVWHYAYVPCLGEEENKEHQVEWIVEQQKADWIGEFREEEYEIMEYLD